MYSRLLDFLLNLLLEKWFWICLYFSLVPGLFFQVYLKACFTRSKIKCTFSISTWYLWTGTISKATLSFQKYVHSCSLCIPYNCSFVLFLIFFLLWNFLLKFLPRKKFNGEPKVSSTVDFIKLDAEEHLPVGCHLWIRQLVGGGRKENSLSPPALAALLSPFLHALVPVLGQREGASREMPVPSRQMSTAAAILDLRGLTSFLCLCW